MTTSLQRQLAEFVDRTHEMSLFTNILDSDSPSVMAIWGDAGVGKSYLLAKMLHECALRSLPKIDIVWTDTRNHNYLAIMRKIRDGLDVKHFSRFTDLVNYYTVPQYELKITVDGSINVAEGLHIEGSTTGDIAGVIIKDMMIPEPRVDMAIPESLKLEKLTDEFIKNLSHALSFQNENTPLVIFLDAVEKISEDTFNWLWGELISRVSDGQLSNIKFVLCGRQELPSNLDRGLKLITEEAALKPLEQSHIAEYLVKRGVDSDTCDALATMLLASTNGNPLFIANSVDAFLKMTQKRNP